MTTYLDRKEKLLSQIDSAKKKIDKLKTKRIHEIGTLAMQYGLADVDDSILEKSFAQLAKEQNISHEQNL